MIAASNSVLKQFAYGLLLLALAVTFGLKPMAAAEPKEETTAADPIKVGILGMDNYQCVAFMALWHKKDAAENLAGLRIVAGYPGKPSPNIPKSETNLPKWVERAVKADVEIVDTPADLIKKVDAVILMSTDASGHLEEVRPVLEAGKPVYIGRPVTTNLEDAVEIFQLAKEYNCPIFTCSQHRYSPGFFDMRNHPDVGKVLGCAVYGGYPPEQPVKDRIWSALHGIETLQTIMGPGCETVTRTSTEDAELLNCVWKDGRIGTWRGLGSGAVKYSALVFGDKGIAPAGKYGYAAPVGGVTPKSRYMGYEGVSVQIANFFKTKQPPVSAAETIEILAILEAGKLSKQQGGVPIKVADVIKAAEAKVRARRAAGK